MNKKGKLLEATLLLALFLPGTSFSSELLWVKIKSKYRYQDIISVCSNQYPSIPIYLSAEVNHDNLSVAYLHKSPSWPYEKKLKLSPEELDEITLHRDSQNRYWLRTIKLSPRMAFFIMKNTHFGLECLKSPFLTMYPVPEFEFDLEGIEEGVKVVLTESMEFSGKTAQENKYEARLLLNQQQYSIDLEE